MTSKEMAKLAIEGLEDKKAEDITEIEENYKESDFNIK